ncbi:hypothetical protein B296_00044823 [Ensete ventricosum]|uniref:Uncharacterized protein n=1 Tax=Ensete ventricosum TaxID=4639 RepID=A0A426XQ78_ENSVE|nr:hypothetical protein B296_00044823 [Ensete ventricosum]
MVPEAFGKRLAEAPSGSWKNAKVPSHCKSHREGEKIKSQAAKDKEPTTAAEGTPTPRARPKSVKELCSAHLREDGRDYYVISISNRPDAIVDVPFEFDLSPLTHSQHYYMALIDRVHDVGRVISALDNKLDILRKNVQRLKEGGDLGIIAMAKLCTSEAQILADHLKTDLEEAIRRRELLEKELSETWKTLSDSRDHLAEARG